jgi:hypothetical protein
MPRDAGPAIEKFLLKDRYDRRRGTGENHEDTRAWEDAHVARIARSLTVV